jgi:hypothetical protein
MYISPVGEAWRGGAHRSLEILEHCRAGAEEAGLQQK